MAAVKLFYYLGSPTHIAKITRPLLRTLSTSESSEVRASVLANCVAIAEEQPVGFPFLPAFQYLMTISTGPFGHRTRLFLHQVLDPALHQALPTPNSSRLGQSDKRPSSAQRVPGP